MSGPIQKYFRPGQYVFREGDPSRAMFLIKKGSISVRKRKGGAFVELARIYTNEVIGELSFFDKRPRSAAAIALTEVEVLEIPFEALDLIYKNVPDYIKTIMASVAERLRKADEVIRKLQKETVVEGVQGEPAEDSSEYQNTAAVLAATADFDFSGSKISKLPKPEEAASGETEPSGSEDEDSKDKK